MIRAVTNVVLMISDLDIIFSFLFAVQVINLDGLWKLGVIVHVIGVLTYFAGALYFGPRQKYRVVKMVQDMMMKYPNEFKSNKGAAQTTVGMESRLAPNAQRGPKFGDLTADQEGFDQFKTGLAEWGLIHMWNYCEIKNAKNTTEVKHGVPFLRLARFGFVAEPTPKDLGCILNANALYTFCTGTFQLVYGAIIMAMQGEVKLEIVLPLSISGVSFLLSVANVAMDFSGVLTAIEGERRLKEQVLQASDNERIAQKRRAEQRRDADLQDLESQFQGRAGAADLVEKSKRKKEAMNLYQINVQDIEAQNLTLLEMELVNYRRRLESIKAVESGKSTYQPEAQTLGSLQEYDRATTPLKTAKDKIEQHAAEQLNLMDPTNMSGEEFGRAVEQIQREKMAKLRIIEEQLETLRLQFTGGQSGPPGGAAPAGDAAARDRYTRGPPDFASDAAAPGRTTYDRSPMGPSSYNHPAGGVSDVV